MEALSFRNDYVQNQPQEVQKRLESNENFTALDNEKLKQDTVEIASKAKKSFNDNPFFGTLNNLFGIDLDNPKKTGISIALSVITVIAVMIIGNKTMNPVRKLGHTIDKVLAGDNFIGKFRNKIIELVKKIGNNLTKKADKIKVIQNAKAVFNNPDKVAKQKWNLFRGIEQGAKGLFSNTIIETIQKAVKKDEAKALETLTNVLGSSQKAEAIIKAVADEGIMGNKINFCDKLLNDIAQANNCELGSEVFGNVLDKLSKGGFGEGTRYIKMSEKGLGGVLASWWPANIVNSIIKSITGKETQMLQGDLGDSLIKYAAVRGKLAKTAPAKLVQIIPPLVGDYISNFVNDKSGFGVLLCLNLVSNFNKLQDAPKEKKAVTAVNDVASGSLNWLVGFPLAFGAIYSTASLANMEGKDILTRLGRGIGKIIGIGLNNKEVTKTGLLGELQKLSNATKGTFGGIMRFVLFMTVLTPIISKTIEKVCAKIFGKPYSPEEVEKQKQLEEEKNKIVPELGITQGELQQRIEKNPEAVKKMQNNPDLVKAIDKNPKLMLDLLDGKEIDVNEALKTPQSNTQSPMLQNMIKNGKPSVSNEVELFGTKNKEKNEQKEESYKIKDSATYIPNSAFIAQRQELSPEAKKQYDALMANSDKILAKAEKYI